MTGRMTITRIAIAGNFDPSFRPHRATVDALDHAAAAASVTLETSWISTGTLEHADAAPLLSTFDGVWAAPMSSVGSLDGALKAIRFARENGWPFFGT